MKRLFSFLILLIVSCLFLFYPRLIHAQETGLILPRPNGTPFLGQDHTYSLILRGNGEAIVSMKVILANTTDEEVSEIQLRIPKVSPKEFNIFQVILEPSCIRYDPANATTCLEYQEPNYYYYWGNPKYQKAKYSFEGDTLTVKLPQPIKSNGAGSFFVHFRSFGFTNKNVFGAYKYEFETLKVSDEINNLQIGIDTDSDLLLKDAQGEVGYRYEEPSATALQGMESTPGKSAALDKFIINIGQGRIVKNASNLSKLESYKVEGMYGKNIFSLFAKEMIIGVLVILILIIFVVGIVVLVQRRLSRVKEEPNASTLGGVLLSAFGLSFASSIIITGYTFLIFFLMRYLENILGYMYREIFLLFMVIISIGVYALLFFAPAVYMGWKKGLGWGIGTMILTVFTLLIFLAISFVLISVVFRNNPYYPTPIYPLMDKIQLQGGPETSVSN